MALQSANMASEITSTSNTLSPRVLLLSGTVPGEPGVGGIILQDLVEYAGLDRFAACLFPQRTHKKTNFLPELDACTIARRYETAWRPIKGFAGEWVAWGAGRIFRGGHLDQLYRQVQQKAVGFKPDIYLVILDSITTIELAARLQQTSLIPLRCIVWDDPSLLCDQAQLDKKTRYTVMQKFARVLKASERIAVICENMQQRYRERYQVESFILRHGIEGEFPLTSSDTNKNKSEYRIGFAGSITTPDCFRMLLQTLDQMQWRLGDADIILRLFGARHLLETRQPQRIEYFGWQPFDRMLRFLGECDLMYQPQSFSEGLRTFSELSFPTKLSTYVSLGKPILLHAPDYASLSTFWQDYPAGPHCDQLDSEKLQTSVERGLTPPQEEKQSWMTSLKRIHGERLGIKQFHAAIEQLVGAAEAAE